MKKLFLALALASALSFSATAQTPRHRHNAQTVQTAVKPDTAAATAFSDTTSTATTDEDSADYDEEDAPQVTKKVNFTDVEDPFQLIGYLTTLSVGGVIIAIFFIILCIVTVSSPFVFLALIIYWVMHRKNREYNMVEKAIENGQPIPEGVLHKATADKEWVWQRGIKSIAIGAGIAVFGIFMRESFFLAVGAIFACWGIGQCVIARTSASRQRDFFKEESYEDITDDGTTNKAE